MPSFSPLPQHHGPKVTDVQMGAVGPSGSGARTVLSVAAVIALLGFALLKLPADSRAYARRAARHSRLNAIQRGASRGGMVKLSEVPVEAINHDGSPGAKQVMVTRGQVPHLTGFSRAELAPDEEIVEHTHMSRDEVFYVLSGEGVFVVDGVDVTAAPGVCVHVAAGQRHKVRNGSGGTMVLLYFGTF